MNNLIQFPNKQYKYEVYTDTKVFPCLVTETDCLTTALTAVNKAITYALNQPAGTVELLIFSGAKFSHQALYIERG